MSCVSLSFRDKFDGHDYFTDFTSSSLDGSYAEGGYHTGNIHFGKNGFMSPEALKETAIQHTLSYLGGKFQTVYGRHMLRSDICGEPAEIIKTVEDDTIKPNVPESSEIINEVVAKAKTSALIPIALIAGVMIAIYLFLFQRR